LGVTCIYLNPIFEAHSNHRYNTADYEKVDPLLGTEEDLRALCDAAKSRGMRVLLDGVFNHTGSDSRYFNRNGRYPETGAFQCIDSPYYDWFDFAQWPARYASWWGFQTLPVIRHDSAEFRKYITDPGGISDKWLACGTAGWRLDVVDELSDPMLDAIRIAVKRADPEALVLGEVWEDASNKVSYNRRRHYLLGHQLDSVMNYPFRKAILEFFMYQDASRFADIVESIVDNYPPQVLRLLMNLLGTHDTERVLTALGGEQAHGRGRAWQSVQKMTDLQRTIGLRRLRAASVLQYCLPGVPSLYYGDEAGLEGYRDPFNRAYYPWGHEDTGLVDWFRMLGALRKKATCLKEGTYRTVAAKGRLLAFERTDTTGHLLCICNAGMDEITCDLPHEWHPAEVLLGNTPQGSKLTLDAISCTVLYLQ
jgi:glycosidase